MDPQRKNDLKPPKNNVRGNCTSRLHQLAPAIRFTFFAKSMECMAQSEVAPMPSPLHGDERMVQPPIPGVCTSWDFLHEKNTAVTCTCRRSGKRLTQLANLHWVVFEPQRVPPRNSLYKVLMHRKSKINIHRNTLRGNVDAAAPSASDGFLVVNLSSLHCLGDFRKAFPHFNCHLDFGIRRICEFLRLHFPKSWYPHG